MPNFAVIVLSSLLFFLLVPGVLFQLPSSSAPKYTVAAAHAVIYGIIGFFFHDSIKKLIDRIYL